MKLDVKLSSENLRSKQDFPTPVVDGVIFGIAQGGQIPAEKIEHAPLSPINKSFIK
jgi:hypothetical protein